MRPIITIELMAAFLNKLRQDQRDVLQIHLEQIATANKERAFYFWAEQFYQSHLTKSSPLLKRIEKMAVIVGMMKQKPELYALVTAIEGAVRK